MMFLLLTLVALSALDVGTTGVGLARGGFELNPLARWLMGKSNPWIVMIGTKLAMIVLAFAIDSVLVYTALILVTVGACGWNLWQLAGHSAPTVSKPATQR